MDLVFRDLEVVINDIKILKKISGVARKGDMLAVMGPSGAGKSTLLSALAGRMTTTRGMITLNGQILGKQLSRKMRFVLQQDVFFPNLTLRQTLTFAALLTLPDKMPYALKLQRVDEIVEILELDKCIGTIMGNEFMPGLSGGERKRATIGCEMMTDPSILLIDEPTSGLDYAIASNLIRTLKKYTDVNNKTIVASIHQPSSQMFYMFTNLLLVADGQVAYFGPCSGVLNHFMNAGLYCNPHYNPADFIMEELRASADKQQEIIHESYSKRAETWPSEIKRELSVSELDKYARNQRRRGSTVSLITDFFNGGFKKRSSQSSLGTITDEIESLPEKSGVDDVISKIGSNKPSLIETDLHINLYADLTSKWPTAFWTQYKVLTQRLMIYAIAKILSPVNIVRSCIICCLVCFIWFQTDRSEKSLDDRLGAIFLSFTYWGFDTILGASAAFDAERAVIMRERSAGMYRLSAYWLAKQTSELPLTICMPSIFLVIVYWTVGFNNTVWVFFAVLFIFLLYVMIIQGVGLFIGVLFQNLHKTISSATVVMIIFMLVAGYFQRHLGPWISWLRWASPLTYMFHAGLILEFKHGSDLKCLPANTTAYGVCLTTSKTAVPGEAILQDLGITQPLWFYCMILCAYFILSRCAIYLTLKYLRKPATHK